MRHRVLTIWIENCIFALNHVFDRDLNWDFGLKNDWLFKDYIALVQLQFRSKQRSIMDIKDTDIKHEPTF